MSNLVDDEGQTDAARQDVSNIHAININNNDHYHDSSFDENPPNSRSGSYTGATRRGIEWSIQSHTSLLFNHHTSESSIAQHQRQIQEGSRPYSNDSLSLIINNNELHPLNEEDNENIHAPSSSAATGLELPLLSQPQSIDPSQTLQRDSFTPTRRISVVSVKHEGSDDNRQILRGILTTRLATSDDDRPRITANTHMAPGPVDHLLRWNSDLRSNSSASLLHPATGESQRRRTTTLSSRRGSLLPGGKHDPLIVKAESFIRPFLYYIDFAFTICTIYLASLASSAVMATFITFIVLRCVF